MKLFLDDYRDPSQCAAYMVARLGSKANVYLEGDWYIVRNYEQFIKALHKYMQHIKLVSFDHDLADGHYHKNMQEGVINYNSEDFNTDAYKTGYHCAMYMKRLFEPHEGFYALPEVLVHSMNPVGVENIKGVFTK